MQNDTFTNMELEDIVLDHGNEQEDTNGTSNPEKQIRSGRMSRRPKQYEDFELL